MEHFIWKKVDEVSEAADRLQVVFGLNDQATSALQLSLQALAYSLTSPPYMAQRQYPCMPLWTSLENNEPEVDDEGEPEPKAMGQQALALMLDEISEAGVLIEDDTEFLARLVRLPTPRGSTKIPVRVADTGAMLYVERRRLERLVEDGHAVARALRMLIEDQVCSRCLLPDPQRVGPSMCPDCELDVIGDLLELSAALA